MATVLQMDVSRVTILPQSSGAAADSLCQTVSYMVAGEHQETTEELQGVERFFSEAENDSQPEERWGAGLLGWLLVPA